MNDIEGMEQMTDLGLFKFIRNLKQKESRHGLSSEEVTLIEAAIKLFDERLAKVPIIYGHGNQNLLVNGRM